MRRRLTAARQLGVSLRRFDGWEPVQRTRVTEWTPDGRPAAWQTSTEPEWDPRQRALMLALQWWEAGLCRRCGQHLDETTDPNNDPDNPHSGRTWVADGPDECFACKVLHRAEQSWEKTSPEAAPYSIWAPQLRDRPPRHRPGGPR